MFSDAINHPDHADDAAMAKREIRRQIQAGSFDYSPGVLPGIRGHSLARSMDVKPTSVTSRPGAILDVLPARTAGKEQRRPRLMDGNDFHGFLVVRSGGWTVEYHTENWQAIFRSKK